MSVRQLYQSMLDERGYVPDEAQLRAIDALERCENEWLAYKARRGNALTKMLVRPPIPRGVVHVRRGGARQELPDGLLFPVRAAQAQDAPALP